MNNEFLLSAIILLPTFGALAMCAFRSEAAMRSFGNAITFLTFILTLFAWLRFDAAGISADHPMQMTVKATWIASWNVNYQLGLDGISMPLVVLTSLISWLAMLASVSVTKQLKGYLILYLILETGMLGVFMALDFFLFYVFWEVMLLPMYFLIGIWGGPRKEYAAIKFFLYTLAGSVLMLLAIIAIYYNSLPHGVMQFTLADGSQAAGNHTFNMMYLA